MPFSSFFRSYTKGWAPSSHHYRNEFYSRSTIRDIGKGSSRLRDFFPKAEQTAEPRTYEEVKEYHLEQGTLWEDPDFPAGDSSIYFRSPPSVWPDIEWKRPSEICDDPQLFVDGASRLDVIQGILGDCWLLAAVSSLATNEKLLHRVIPYGQSLTEDYAGVFRFHFWQYGRWIEVIVDDRLPVHDGQLIYMHSDTGNEFWSALMEKAFAKLHGSYENLGGGLTSEALTDFTGGIVERISLQADAPEDLIQQMLKARERGALMGCSIDATPGTMEDRLDSGLIIGHAYSITDVRLVDIETPRVSGKIPMVRIRNPWGGDHEWKGAWSDQSEEWNYIPEDEKEEMGLTFEHDGEFWMSFSDFKKHFMRLEICRLGPDSKLSDDDLGDGEHDIARWESTLNEGSWKRHCNAGGCRNFEGSFWTNPQYRINIPEPDEGEEDGLGSIIVGLMQKERRKLKKVGKDNVTMGYAMYTLDNPNVGTLDRRFFQTHVMTAKSTSFINMREVCDHHKLPPGDYVIIPSTYEPNEEADFVLRVFSEKPDDVKELDDETGEIEEMTPEEEEEPEVNEDDKEAGREAFVSQAGSDGEIDAYELKDLLNNTFQQEFEFDGFSTDMCRSMVSMADADLSGKLNFNDFTTLWADLLSCKKVFKALDADGNGYFNSYEFREALKMIASKSENIRGLRISNSTFNAIVLRYGDKDGHVRFDDFVACVIKLKTLYQTFKAKTQEHADSAEFKMDEFIQLTMYS